MSTTRLVKQNSFESGKKRGHVRMGTFGPWNPEIYDGMFPSEHYPPSKIWARETPHYSRSTNPTSSRHKTRSENRVEQPSSVAPAPESGREHHPRGTFGIPEQNQSRSKVPTSRQSSSLRDDMGGSEIVGDGRIRTLSSISQTLASAKPSRPEPQASSSKPRAAIDGLASSSTSSTTSLSWASRSAGGSPSSTPKKRLQIPTSANGPSPEVLSRTLPEPTRIRPTQLPDGPRPRNPPSQALSGDISISIPAQRPRRPQTEPLDHRLSPVAPPTISSLERTPSPPSRRLTILLPEASSSRIRTNSRPSTPVRPLPIIINNKTRTSTPSPRSPRTVNGVPTNPRAPEPKMSLKHPRSAENISRPQSPIRTSSPGPPPSFTNPFASSRPIPIPRLDTSMHLHTEQSPPSSSHPFEATFLHSPTSEIGPSATFSDGPTFTNPFAPSPRSARRTAPRVLTGPRSRNGTSSPSPQSPVSPTSASRPGVLPSQSPLQRPITPTRHATSPVPRRTSLQPPADLGAANAFRKTSLPNCLDTISEGIASQPKEQYTSQLNEQYASWGRSSATLVEPTVRSPTFQEQRVDLRKWSQKIDPARDLP